MHDVVGLARGRDKMDQRLCIDPGKFLRAVDRSNWENPLLNTNARNRLSVLFGQSVH